MAAITNTYKTATVIGMREDLSDLISNISPTATPFTTAAGRGKKAKATRVEWQLDSLAAADNTNYQLEGDDVTFPVVSPTSRVGNICQILSKALILSDTAEEVDKAGRKSELAYQIAKRGKELKRDLEKITIGTNQGASTADPRKMACMPAFLRTNVVDGGGAAADPSAPSGGLYTGTRTAGTTQTFTEDLLKDALQQMYTSGGDVDGAVLMVDPTQKTIASTFAGIATPFKNVGSGQATIVGAVDVYVSDFGEISIVPNRFQRSLDAWVLDFALIRLRDLRPYQVKDLAKTGDATKKYMVTETTLQVDNEAGLALITDLV